jgi:osmotically-inducible protein OsmY
MIIKRERFGHMNSYPQSKHRDLAKGSQWSIGANISHSADEDLAASAVDAIECLTTISTETLKVSARKGWLRLEGNVNWPDQRMILEQVTRHLPGVAGVIDSLAIRP